MMKSNMARRNTELAVGEYYHVYNRGSDKRNIFADGRDLARFLQSMQLFNTKEPVGSMFRFYNETGHPRSRLSPRGAQSGQRGSGPRIVTCVAFCLNPNHFHFLIQPLIENGVQIFMARLGGYSSYFNKRHKRNGTLFGGRFKSVYVNKNEQLLRLSVYINLNYLVHKLRAPGADRDERLAAIRRERSAVPISSWNEYRGKSPLRLTTPDIVLDQFKTTRTYERFARDMLPVLLERKAEEKELEALLLE